MTSKAVASAHRPKTAALIAYAEGLLSARARAFVGGHLEGCDACRRELAAIELYERAIDDVRDAPPPAVDFEAMELTLAREARRISQQTLRATRRRTWYPWVAAAVAVAAVIALFLTQPEPPRQWSQGGAAPAPVPAERVAPEVPESEPLRPVVTLAAGTATRTNDVEREDLEPGAALVEADVLETGADGRLHVAMADGMGFALAPDSRLELSRIRVDEVELRLAGRVDQGVSFTRTSTYTVLAGGYAVAVTGTRFAVSYVDDELGVDLSEGRVRIETPDGETIALEAPARWSSAGAVDGEPEVRLPRAPVEGPAATIADPRVVRWEVDVLTIESPSVRLALAPGEHEVHGWDADGRRYTATLPVVDAPVALPEGALVAEAPREAPGHLEPEVIGGVVNRGRRNLSRCYELALRRGASISGRINLRVRVGRMGDVERVSVLGLEGDGHAELATCIERYVRQWTFPPPGGPLSFDAPMTLAPTQ